MRKKVTLYYTLDDLQSNFFTIVQWSYKYCKYLLVHRYWRDIMRWSLMLYYMHLWVVQHLINDNKLINLLCRCLFSVFSFFWMRELSISLSTRSLLKWRENERPLKGNTENRSLQIIPVITQPRTSGLKLIYIEGKMELRVNLKWCNLGSSVF